MARCIARLLDPTGGKILFDGVDITHLSRSEMRPVRRDIERRLVGADRSDLARDHPAGQLIVEVECLDRPASLELVQPTTDAMHSSTNAFSLSLAPS